MTDAADGEHTIARRRRSSPRDFVTAEAVYGLILFCAVIAAAPVEDPDQDIALKGMVASIAIWFAHVIAVTVARHGGARQDRLDLRTALKEALAHSSGILVAPVVPVIALALGSIGLVDEMVGYWSAIIASVAILGVLGALASAERGMRWYRCLVYGLLTAAAGLIAITLKGLFG